MKYILSTILCISLSVISAQDGARKAIAAAIGSGDVGILADHLARELTLSFHDEERILAKAAAESRLRKFYAENKAITYKVRHNGGAMRDKSSYMVGRLMTENLSYRVFVYLEKDRKGVSKISEIRFEKPL